MDRTGIAAFPPRAQDTSRPFRWSWRGRRGLATARQAADAELLTSEFTSPRTAWRAAELVEPKNRLALARSIRRVVRCADVRFLPGATPLNRLAVREEAGTLNVLAEQLSDLVRPVRPQGVLLLDRLLTDGYGPLYVSYRALELRDGLLRVLDALGARR